MNHNPQRFLSASVKYKQIYLLELIEGEIPTTILRPDPVHRDRPGRWKRSIEELDISLRDPRHLLQPLRDPYLELSIRVRQRVSGLRKRSKIESDAISIWFESSLIGIRSIWFESVLDRKRDWIGKTIIRCGFRVFFGEIERETLSINLYAKLFRWGGVRTYRIKRGGEMKDVLV